MARVIVQAFEEETGLIRQYTKMSGTAMSQFISCRCGPDRGRESPAPPFAVPGDGRAGRVHSLRGGEQRLGARMTVRLIRD